MTVGSGSGGRTGGRGLDATGHIEREGSLLRVGADYLPIVDDTRRLVTDLFGDRLHGLYLYGSVPRGTAVPHRSDLDVLVTLRAEPTEADREALLGIAARLDADNELVDGVGMLLHGASRVLSAAERHDMAFFVACLCTPLAGDDLAARLPRYRPSVVLARETNGDLAAALARFRGLAGTAATDAEWSRLCRVVARKVVRTGFTLVMPRWNGWTSDLDEAATAFARYYPRWGGRMAGAAAWGRTPSPDPAVVHELLDGLGDWLAGEYARTVGTRTPRPQGG